MAFFQTVMDFFCPPVCPFCSEDIFEEDAQLCGECLANMPQLPERRCSGCGGPNDTCLDLCRECVRVEGGRPWKLAVSAFPFYGNARLAVHQFKYRGKTALAPFLAKCMAQAWLSQAIGKKVDAISYIPLHILRYIRRGYNQSEILAELVG